MHSQRSLCYLAFNWETTIVCIRRDDHRVHSQRSLCYLAFNSLPNRSGEIVIEIVAVWPSKS